MGKLDKSAEKEKPLVARDALGLQKMKLEKLMKNPDKPVIIPERQKDKKLPHVPDFVRNVMGSSAGAGSGEFHVYRHLRRKEYARQKIIHEKSEKAALDEEYQRKLEENRKKAEERTAKKRAKRLKKKEKLKKKKVEGDKKPQSDAKTSDSEDSDAESTDGQGVSEDGGNSRDVNFTGDSSDADASRLAPTSPGTRDPSSPGDSTRDGEDDGRSKEAAQVSDTGGTHSVEQSASEAEASRSAPTSPSPDDQPASS